MKTGTENGGSANLEWIKLGHATDKEIQKLVESTKFSDIFEVTDDAVKGKAAGYTAIKTSANGKKTEWVKVKPGMEKAAAFLETHRYAAYLGATVEFKSNKCQAPSKKLDGAWHIFCSTGEAHKLK